MSTRDSNFRSTKAIYDIGIEIQRLKPHAADPQNKTNANIYKISKIKIVKNRSYLKVSGKMDCTIEFSAFFYIG